MDIKYEFRNIERVESVAYKAPEVFQRNMVLAAKVSARDVQKTARAKHNFRSRTGFTELAVETEIQTTEAGVVGKVFLNENVSPWGKYVHEGTRPHWIRPKNKKVLRWPASNGAGFRFARMVHHPGTQPDQFIYKAGERNQSHINNVFNRYADRACREVGL